MIQKNCLLISFSVWVSSSSALNCYAYCCCLCYCSGFYFSLSSLNCSVSSLGNFQILSAACTCKSYCLPRTVQVNANLRMDHPMEIMPMRNEKKAYDFSPYNKAILSASSGTQQLRCDQLWLIVVSCAILLFHYAIISIVTRSAISIV